MPGVLIFILVIITAHALGTVFGGWTVLGSLGSLVSGTPSLPVFLIAGIDVAALWTVCGETGRQYFSVRSPAPTARQGFPA